jgi:erythromycin esterase
MLNPAEHRRLLRITGKVTAKGDQGALMPIRDALVAVVPKDFRVERIPTLPVMKTDPDGNFSFELKPGAYTISATAPRWVGSGIEVSADASLTIPLDLHLVKASTDALELQGTLLGPQRKPLAQARVVAVRVDSNAREVFLTGSDSDGRFKMIVPRAKYALVSADGSLMSRELILPRNTLNRRSSDLILLPSIDPPAPQETVAWLRERAVPLRRVGDDIEISDRDAILRAVRDARVVGVGESAHGGHEFALTKVRLFQMLVKEAAFNVFAIEASHPECVDIDNYVLGGEGDPALLLSRLRFWVTDTAELLDLIKWMRAYNADPGHPQKLRFFGFDMQFTPRAVASVLQYLATVDPKFEAQVAAGLAPLASEFDFENFRRLSQPLRDRTTATVESILQRLEVYQNQYHRHDSVLSWSTAWRMAQTLVQAVKLKACRHPGCELNDARDKYMADNVLQLLGSEPNTRLMLWAANAHVAADAFLDWKPMGTHLRNALGNRYAVIGFAFNRGSLNAFGDDPVGPVMAIDADPAMAGSLDETLARVGQRAFLVDIRRAPGHDEAAQWLMSEHRTHDMGASFSDVPSDEYWPLVVPRKAYDALIFIDEIMPSKLRHPRGRFTPECLTRPVNLNMETVLAGSHAPAGWSMQERSIRSGYRVQTVSDGCSTGRRCALIDRPGTIEVPYYGSLTQDIEANPFRDHKIRVSANVRVERADASTMPQQAELWVAALGDEGKILTFAGMAQQPITSFAWQRYAVTVAVPPEAVRVRFGIAVDGNIRVWLDDVAVEPSE